MSALRWTNSGGTNVTTRACEVCRETNRTSKGKATWFPVIAGYWLETADPLGQHFGMCLKCRDEWDAIWRRKGLA